MKLNILFFISIIMLLTKPILAKDTLKVGDAVISQFSGVITPKEDEIFPQKIKKPTYEYSSNYKDEIFIDTQGSSIIVKGLETEYDHIWDTSILNNKEKLQIKAKEIGQVFGITLDDNKNPNIYVSATSFYGLNIVLPDTPNKLKVKINSKKNQNEYKEFITNDIDLRLERQIHGIKNAKWMDGQFGKKGTPGSIWKINSKSGKVSKFVDIKLNGVSNSGPALGNISFDSKHKQFFVSDLDTGMIHRISSKGKDVEYFDHGISARKSYNLKQIPHNPLNIANINSKDFDTTNTNTWGYAKIGRRIYALSYIQDRVFYAVYNGEKIPGEIWSVGIDTKGRFSKDIHFEVKLDKLKENLPITDMVLTDDGQMILSQRALNKGSYDMSDFTQNKKAQTIKYHLKIPNEGYLQRWYEKPQEYYIGFNKDYRKTAGGVSLGYNYNNKGQIDYKLCNKTLWVSGENLRDNIEFNLILGENISGIQGVPSVLTSVNKPSWNSLFLSSTKRTYQTKGHLGDIEIYQKPCVCKCSTVNYTNLLTKKTIYPFSHPSMPNSFGTTVGGGTILFPPPNCLTFPLLPGCNSNNTTSERKLCMEAKTTPAGPFDEGGGLWSFPIQITSLNGNTIDRVKITPVSGVSAITNGPIFPVGTPNPILSGTTLGNNAIVNLCGFDSTQATSGEPFECCNMKVKIKIRDWQSSDDNQQLEVVK